MAEELVKGVSSVKDLSTAFSKLMKKTLEKALPFKMDVPLGYEKNSSSGRNKQNSRNGTSRKTLKTEFGEIDLETPRDRESSFEPQLVRKGQRCFTGLDDKILLLYAKGQSTRDIELYGVEVSHTFISQVTESVVDEVREWQMRALDDIYPIVYLDCLVVKIHQDKRVINKAIYVALGINTAGHKELMGL